jgi:carboxymethylenebutenolidase
MSDVELIKQKRGGDCEIYLYPEGQHGFNCEERGSYNEAAAMTGRKRASEFLAKHLK